MKKRFIIPLIIIFSVILSICVSAQPSQADTPLENSESYTDVSVQESANQLYESLMSAFNSAMVRILPLRRSLVTLMHTEVPT